MVKVSTKEAMRLARVHLSNTSSRVAMADAVAREERGDLDGALRRSLGSLIHSVGIFHDDYEKVRRMCLERGIQ